MRECGEIGMRFALATMPPVSRSKSGRSARSPCVTDVVTIHSSKEHAMIRTLALALIVSLTAMPVLAQDASKDSTAPKMSPEEAEMMAAYQKAGTPGPQHAALAEHAGTYDVKIRSWEKPGAPPMEETGTATRSMLLDGRVMAEEMHATMHGQPFTGHGMEGYDNVSGKYWSTWNDSMSTGLMVSEGTCDAQHVCTFTGSWNDPVTNAKVTTRMTTRWTSPTVEQFEMYGPGQDGKEMKMMELTYTKR
jgi:hypothetical protein